MTKTLKVNVTDIRKYASTQHYTQTTHTYINIFIYSHNHYTLTHSHTYYIHNGILTIQSHTHIVTRSHNKYTHTHSSTPQTLAYTHDQYILIHYI